MLTWVEINRANLIHNLKQFRILFDGVRCPVRGRVCINLMMVEVTRVKPCKAGDNVTLIGAERNNEITADELAALTPDTLNYEISTHINPFIPRKVV